MTSPGIDLRDIPDPDLRHEWEHFRGYNLDDAEIARRLSLPDNQPDLWKLAASRRRKTQIVKLVEAGHTDQQIADALSLSIWTVKRHRTQAGINRRSGSDPALAERRARVAELTAAGKSKREVAKALGIARSTVDADRAWNKKNQQAAAESGSAP